MKKIIALILFALSFNAFSYEIVQGTGNHTYPYTLKYKKMMAPGEDVRTEFILPKANTKIGLQDATVWTGVKSCLITLPGIEDDVSYKPNTDLDRVVTQTWMVNQDDVVNLPAAYYFNHDIKSWQGNSCSDKEVFENPVHLHHNTHFFIRCKNLSTTRTSMCKVSVTIDGRYQQP
jgi:hypothetical protein